MVLPEAFLGTDVLLTLCLNVTKGFHVWPQVIAAHVQAELPFMATENILMACVKAGGDRQDLHEAIREHSMAAGKRVKEEGADNDLLSRIAIDKKFVSVHATLHELVNPLKFIGRCPEQVDEFLKEQVSPVLVEYASLLEVKEQDTVGV